jgi:hypothetical protein
LPFGFSLDPLKACMRRRSGVTTPQTFFNNVLKNVKPNERLLLLAMPKVVD